MPRAAENNDGDFAGDNDVASELLLRNVSEEAVIAGVSGSSSPGLPAIIDALYGQIKNRIILQDVKPSNVMIILTCVMAACEKQKSLSGPEKKEAVVYLVRRFVGEIPGDNGDRQTLQAAVELLLPPLIDTLIAATRGKLDLNKDGVISADEVSQATAGCWRMCFPCCSPAPASGSSRPRLSTPPKPPTAPLCTA